MFFFIIIDCNDSQEIEVTGIDRIGLVEHGRGEGMEECRSKHETFVQCLTTYIYSLLNIAHYFLQTRAFADRNLIQKRAIISRPIFA